MTLTPEFEAMFKGYLIDQTPFVVAEWWVALLNDTSGAPITVNELDNLEYSRKQVQWDTTNYWNTNELRWDAVAESWGTVSGVALCSAATGHNALIWTTMTSTSLIPGQALRISPTWLRLDFS